MRFAFTTVTTPVALALAALAGASAASAAMFARVFVPPGGELVLDGGGAEGFALSGQNVGRVAVRIVARSGGHDRWLDTVAPGERLDQDFAPREAAVLVNTSPAEDAVATVRTFATREQADGAE